MVFLRVIFIFFFFFLSALERSGGKPAIISGAAAKTFLSSPALLRESSRAELDCFFLFLVDKIEI